MIFKLLSVLLVSVSVSLGQSLPILVTNVAEAKAEGRALVQELLAQKPAENTTVTGVLKIRAAKGKTTEVPVNFDVSVTNDSWRSDYITHWEHSLKSTNASEHGQGIITIVHVVGQTNRYYESSSHWSGRKGVLGVPRSFAGNDTMIPFAGSDFWVADLGLEFFHWPDQRVTRKEMRKNQFCKVLESINPQPAPGAYARVLSWIDHDSLGIIHAEAYDQKNKLLKEFDPKEVQKVEGRWELREMEIRNAQTGSRTRLEFNLEKD